MNNVETFLVVNNLRQKDLAEFLGISSAAVSKMIKSGNISSFAKGRIVLNDRGWDVTMFTNGEMVYTKDFVKAKTPEDHQRFKDKFSKDHVDEELAWYKKMFQELTKRVMEQDILICSLQSRIDMKQEEESDDEQ